MLGFAGILLGMFSIGMMQLILATALPFIVKEIGGGSLYSWVFSNYMLASLAAIPLFSKLADIYGKRKIYAIQSNGFKQMNYDTQNVECHNLDNYQLFVY